MEWALSLYSQLLSMFFLSSYRYQYSNRGFKLEKTGWADMGQSKNWVCEEHAHSWVLGLTQCLAAEWACAGEWTTQSVPWKQHWPGRWLFFPLPIWYSQISFCTLWEIQWRSHICTHLWTSQGNCLQYRQFATTEAAPWTSDSVVFAITQTQNRSSKLYCNEAMLMCQEQIELCDHSSCAVILVSNLNINTSSSRKLYFTLFPQSQTSFWPILPTKKHFLNLHITGTVLSASLSPQRQHCLMTEDRLVIYLE